MLLTADFPECTRTVTDLAHRMIYLPQPEAGQHDSRALALQPRARVLDTRCLGTTRRSWSSESRSTTSLPRYSSRNGALTLLRKAKAAKDIAIEDLRDAYAVSYETAAHRFTNLATRRLDIPVHFMRIASTGVIYKAYENDGVHFPNRCHRRHRGTAGLPLLDGACSLRPARCVVGVPEVHRHHIGYVLVHRCGRPDSGGTVLGERRSALHPGEVDARTRDKGALHVQVPRSRMLFTAARGPGHPLGRTGVAQRPGAFHLLAAMPPGVFPGVDDTEVLKFLERHGGA